MKTVLYRPVFINP
jgi:hypothetical protein